MKLVLSKKEGFTLIEVMLAIVLLAVLAISVMAAYGGSINLSASDLRRTAAINVARERLESIKRFEGLNSPDATWIAALNGLPTSAEINGINYQITTSFLTATDIPALAASIDNVRAVRITVDWVDAGAAQQVSYITYYAR